MRVMLQGYLQDANFGDMLFAHLFYDRCKKVGFQEIDFFDYKEYGIGPFCRKELGYEVNKSIISCLKADCFVLISGGALWNEATRKNDAGIRFRRFVLPALLYQLMGKPVYILGVGGGRVDTLWLRKLMVLMLKKARVLYFRDNATKQVFDSYGVERSKVTIDTALIIKEDMLPEFEEYKKLEHFAHGRKKMLLHLPDGKMENQYLAELIIPELIYFLKEHTEYSLVVSNDNMRNLGQEEKQVIENIRNALKDAHIEIYDYKYHDSMQMCSLINEVDSILTLKLHVGVVGAALGKCVVSFPVHREKTNNFYKMICESDRCINIRNLYAGKVYEQLETFHNKPIYITDEWRFMAEKNLSVLDEIIKENSLLRDEG